MKNLLSQGAATSPLTTPWLLSEKLYILYFVKASASFVFASSGPNAL